MVLRAGNPDMPARAAEDGEACTATAVIMPELNLESLLARGGHGLVTFFETRAHLSCSSADAADCAMLMKLHARSRMPCFSGAAFRELALAWVDPKDPEESISGLPLGAAAEDALAVRQDLLTGRLVEADVWVTKRVRQAAIVSFLQQVM